MSRPRRLPSTGTFPHFLTKAPFGEYFSFDRPVSEVQTRIDKAIPPVWASGKTAPLDTGFAIRIPAGTWVHEGDIATQGDWYMGGTGQVYVQAPWDIPGAEVVDQWDLVR